MIAIAATATAAVLPTRAHRLALLLAQQLLRALAHGLLLPAATRLQHELFARRTRRRVTLLRARVAAGKKLAAGLVTGGSWFGAWDVEF